MKQVYLTRYSQNEQGTRGIMYVDNSSYHTLELPWRNNQKNISCIPADTYNVTIRQSPKFGTVYWVLKVPNRTYILIHAGNLAGDIAEGYITHTNGCILLGKHIGELHNQKAVLVSHQALRNFMNHLNNKDFKLTILDFSEG